MEKFQVVVVNKTDKWYLKLIFFLKRGKERTALMKNNLDNERQSIADSVIDGATLNSFLGHREV